MKMFCNHGNLWLYYFCYSHWYDISIYDIIHRTWLGTIMWHVHSKTNDDAWDFGSVPKLSVSVTTTWQNDTSFLPHHPTPPKPMYSAWGGFWPAARLGKPREAFSLVYIWIFCGLWGSLPPVIHGRWIGGWPRFSSSYACHLAGERLAVFPFLVGLVTCSNPAKFLLHRYVLLL